MGFITILSVCKDSCSLMGGSGVVHCVRLPLTSERSTMQWTTGQSKSLMDTRVRTNEDTGKSVVLQAAC